MILIFLYKFNLQSNRTVTSTRYTVSHIKRCNLDRSRLFVCQPRDVARQILYLSIEGKEHVCDVPRGCAQI